MYEWYQNAKVCYAHLEDVQSSPFITNKWEAKWDEEFEQEIHTAKWFTRGWTLQELLAPSDLQFFGALWQPLGSKWALLDLIVQRTGIDRDTLGGRRQLADNSIARRMSWASNRETTRLEDAAYCLLGIFDVNLPLLYGEGDKAFLRLQEEILKNSMDHSLFAWEDIDRQHLDHQRRGLLARSPRDFQRSGRIVPFRSLFHNAPYSMTNKGLQLQLPLVAGRQSKRSIALLDCHYEDDFSGCVGIELVENEFGIYERRRPCRVKLVRHIEQQRAITKSIYGLRDAGSIREEESAPAKCHCLLRYPHAVQNEFLVRHAECWEGTEHLWSGSNMVLSAAYHASSEFCPRLAGFFMSHRPSQRNLVILLIYFVATPSAFSAAKLVTPTSVVVLPEPDEVNPAALLEEWAGYLDFRYLGDAKAAWDRHLNDLGMKQCEIDDEYEVRVELKEELIFGETIWVIDVAKVRSKGHRWCGAHSHFDTGKLCAHFPAQPKADNASEMTESTVDLSRAPSTSQSMIHPQRSISNYRRYQKVRTRVTRLKEENYFSDGTVFSDGPDYEGLGYASYEDDDDD
jgi:hypothetical protein